MKIRENEKGKGEFCTTIRDESYGIILGKATSIKFGDYGGEMKCISNAFLFLKWTFGSVMNGKVQIQLFPSPKWTQTPLSQSLGSRQMQAFDITCPPLKTSEKRPPFPTVSHNRCESSIEIPSNFENPRHKIRSKQGNFSPFIERSEWEFKL